MIRIPAPLPTLEIPESECAESAADLSAVPRSTLFRDHIRRDREEKLLRQISYAFGKAKEAPAPLDTKVIHTNTSDALEYKTPLSPSPYVLS